MRRLVETLKRTKGLIIVAAAFCGFLALSLWSGGVAETGRRGDDPVVGGRAAEPSATAPEAMGPFPEAAPEPEAQPPMPSLGGAVFKVVSSVALVVAVLYAGVYLTRTLSRKVSSGNVKADAISVLHKRHIAPKKAIYVVTVGQRAMVVGVTDSQISHLADLSQAEVDGIKVPENDRAKQFKKHLLSFGFGLDDKTKGMER